MPDIDEQLQKKKPFKKKTYRSYLSLDETLDDVVPSTAPTSADVEVLKAEEINPQVILSPKDMFSPEVKLQPKLILSPKENILYSQIEATVETNQKQPAVTNSPQVTMSPEVNLSPEPFDHQKPTIEMKTVKQTSQTSAIVEDVSSSLHQHAAIDDLNIHNSNLIKGFTRVPNSILQVLISGDLTKHELQTLAVILRLTVGFNREEAPISLGVIQNLTGIQSSRISAALNVLIEKNLIKRKSGTINSPNLLSLVFSDEQSKVNLNPKGQNSPKVNIDPKIKKSPHTLGEKVTADHRLENHLQYIQDKHIDSLPLSPEFKNKFIVPLMKKERERLFKLIKELANIPPFEIEFVFNDVFVNKQDTLGNLINSELGYLENCFFKHRDWLKSKLIEKQKQLEAKHRSENLLQSEALEKQKEEEEWNRIVFIFQEQFKSDTEQLAAIDKYSTKMTGVYANVFPARRSFAITKWYEETFGASERAK